MVWEPFAAANITGTFDAFAYGNTVTNGMFGLGLLGGIWVILFMIFSRWGEAKAFGSSSFVTLILAFILRSTGQVMDWSLMLFMGMFLVSFIIMMKDRY